MNKREQYGFGEYLGVAFAILEELDEIIQNLPFTLTKKMHHKEDILSINQYLFARDSQMKRHIATD